MDRDAAAPDFSMCSTNLVRVARGSIVDCNSVRVAKSFRRAQVISNSVACRKRQTLSKDSTMLSRWSAVKLRRFGGTAGCPHRHTRTPIAGLAATSSPPGAGEYVPDRYCRNSARWKWVLPHWLHLMG